MQRAWAWQRWASLFPPLLALLAIGFSQANEDVAIAYLTDCSMYSDW